MSNRSEKRSTTLPLPSSPHWAPKTMTLLMNFESAETPFYQRDARAETAKTMNLSAGWVLDFLTVREFRDYDGVITEKGGGPVESMSTGSDSSSNKPTREV